MIRQTMVMWFLVIAGCADDAVLVDLGAASIDSGVDVVEFRTDAALDTRTTPVEDVGLDQDVEWVPVRDDAVDEWSWEELVRAHTDSTTLARSYAQVGYTLPAGASVFAAVIEPGAGFARYGYFEAGQGGFNTDFWPASTIKVLSALGALEWVFTHGFTGDAQIVWDSGFGDRLGDIVDRAIRVSSNIDYDRTLRAAGWDFMNSDFLSEQRGFRTTVITGSYASVEVRNPGGYLLRENGVEKYIPGRPGVGEYGRNDTNLFELSEGIRRVILHNEIPEFERFRISEADRLRVVDALCGATPSYFSEGASDVLGSVSICHKPGWVPDNECIDHGVVTDSSGRRFLLAAEIPYQAGCAGLSEIAGRTLEALKDLRPPHAVQANFGEVRVQREGEVWTLETDADEVEVWVDGVLVAFEKVSATRFSANHQVSGDPHRLVIRGYKGGAPVVFRAALIE